MKTIEKIDAKLVKIFEKIMEDPDKVVMVRCTDKGMILGSEHLDAHIKNFPIEPHVHSFLVSSEKEGRIMVKAGVSGAFNAWFFHSISVTPSGSDNTLFMDSTHVSSINALSHDSNNERSLINSFKDLYHSALRTWHERTQENVLRFLEARF
jgi:hypothetical protein